MDLKTLCQNILLTYDWHKVDFKKALITGDHVIAMRLDVVIT